MRSSLVALVSLAVLRGLVLGGLLALVGGLDGFCLGLVALPVSLLEGLPDRLRPSTPGQVAVLAIVVWALAFVLLVLAHMQALYTREVIAGGSLVDGLLAIRREYTLALTTHIEDVPIPNIHVEALGFGSAAIAAPVCLLARLAPRPSATSRYSGQRGDLALHALVAYFALVPAQSIVSTLGVVVATGRAQNADVLPFAAMIAGMISLLACLLSVLVFLLTAWLALVWERARERRAVPV